MTERPGQQDGWPRRHRVVLVGLVLVCLQLGLRAWAVFGSWFEFDDFAFLSRVLNQPFGFRMLFEGYGGHLMPAGFLLTWVYGQLAPLDFHLQAATLLALQAIASLGCLVMLRSLFGSRWGILPPLALYLFSTISLPAFVWWAAGVNQVPLQATLFWVITLHVAYLRSGRTRALVGSVVVMVLGLAFYEKVLLVYGAIAIVTLGYFASGSLTSRVGQVLTRYRAAVVAHVATGLAYIALYVVYGYDVGQGSLRDMPWFELVNNFALRAFLTGIVGGPLSWETLSGPFQIADPGAVAVLVALAAAVALVVHIDRTRERSRRAWWLPGWFLGASILLIGAARASVLGPVVGLELRYQSELSAAVALGLGLATMPLLGAIETVAPRRPSALLDRHEWVLAAVTVVSLLALVSSYQYVHVWRDFGASRSYFDNVRKDLGLHRGKVPSASVSVPQYLMWGYRYPENTTSFVLRMYDHRFRYPTITNDRLFVVADDGRIQPAGVTPLRSAVATAPGCGYRVGLGPTTVPLDGPVAGGGFWVRMAYQASAATPVTIEVGDHTWRTTLEEGLHNVYFQADGTFDELVLKDVRPGVRVCTSDLVLGFPQALPSSETS